VPAAVGAVQPQAADAVLLQQDRAVVSVPVLQVQAASVRVLQGLAAVGQAAAVLPYEPVLRHVEADVCLAQEAHPADVVPDALHQAVSGFYPELHPVFDAEPVQALSA